jgi:tetratricopeptide (TPR) repeat protein
MASLLPGYEYDIFISYRQKDNLYDGWVTEFVANLKKELEATFKEEISVYFDINPHDGLLETHDVDASLKEKLKCLVFIPVISRTYCDPKSFAWEHEFTAFVEQASLDQFGLKVTLPYGNVTNRILPVRIHDLDINDIRMCETLIGGVLRGVDLIYRSAGVNRPLRAAEDHPQDNLNKTYYRDQINKVANAIDEIIRSLRNIQSGTVTVNSFTSGPLKTSIAGNERKMLFIPTLRSMSRGKKMILIITIFMLILGSFSIYAFLVLRNTKKTIAVIPFTNPKNDFILRQSGVAYMDAIISKLQEIKSLTVRSRVSTIQYLDTKKQLNEIRDELKINYLVDISIEGTSNNLKMWVGLTKTKGNKQIWAKQYDIDEKKLMPLFTNIVQDISRKLNVEFTPEEKQNIEQDLTKNPQAFINYLSGNARLFTAMGNLFVDSLSFVSAIQFYDKAIEYDPDFAIAYARRAIARSWGISVGQLNSSHIEKCRSDIITAERINKSLPDVQIAYGFYYYYCTKDYINALICFHTANILDPENYQPLFYMALVYRRMGDWDKSQNLIYKVIHFNPQEALYLTNIGLSYTYLHKFDSALFYHQRAIDINPHWPGPYVNKIQTYILRDGNTDKGNAVLDSAKVKTGESLTETRVMLLLYDGKYTEALREVENSDADDFSFRGLRYLITAHIYSLLNNSEAAVQNYDSSLVYFNNDLLKDGSIPILHSYTGMAYAGKGNADVAIAEGKKAIELSAENKNKMDESDMIVNLAMIYTMLGRYDDAMSNIEFALKNPSCLSVKQLQIDPVWKPLFTQKDFNTKLTEYSKNL